MASANSKIGHRSGRLVVLVAAGALSAGLLGACSSSGGSGGSSSNKTPSPAAFDETAAKTQITTNWETFFDPSKPVADKVALLEDGATLQPILDAQSKNPQAKTTKATVKTVVVDPSHVKATVTYDLVPVAGGAPLLAGSTGTSVFQGNTWKVSKSTFCTLIGLAGTTPPQCAS
jgi:hypothetical protein